MKQCGSCEGFVPAGLEACPNCRSTARARSWVALPMALVGAGVATVTLSACYGPACATTVTLPDGGVETYNQIGSSCPAAYDCRAPLADGGDVTQDPEWREYCAPRRDELNDEPDGGSDAGQ